MTAAKEIAADVELGKSKEIEETGGRILRGIHGRVHMSVRRRTPYLSEAISKELAEDVAENIAAYLKELFAL